MRRVFVPPPEPEPEARPAPGRKTAKDPTWECVADGIWRNTKSKRKKTLFERPKIDGVFTFRSLHTSTLKLAKEELARRITQRLQGIEPTAIQQTPAKPNSAKGKVLKTAETTEPEIEEDTPKSTTMGDVIWFYQKSGYPAEYKQERPEGTRKDEATHCITLLKFWDTIPVEKCGPAACDRYHTWKTKTKGCRNGQQGNRMVNRELNTLNNACKWAARSELITFNPIADRPNYQPASAVKHCREFMPHSADELHESAALLFAHPHTVVLGFQMIGEAYTGLRTKEFFKWGTEHYGSLTPDGEYVNAWRCKGQHSINPYCRIRCFRYVSRLYKWRFSAQSPKLSLNRFFN